MQKASLPCLVCFLPSPGAVVAELPCCCAPADEERHFIKYVLAFFASSDGIVMENLAQRFMSGVCLTTRSTAAVATAASINIRCRHAAAG